MAATVVKDEKSLLRLIRNKTPFTFPENSSSWDLQDQALEDDELEFLLKIFEESKVKKIENLMLSGNKFTSKSGHAFRLFLEKNKEIEIRILQLSRNYLEDEGVIAFAKGLRVNNGIKSLLIQKNGLTEAAGEALIAELKDSGNYTLGSLTIKIALKGYGDNNEISEELVARLKNVLSESEREARKVKAVGN